MSQGVIALPFVLYSISKLKINIKEKCFQFLLFYLLIVFFFFAIDGFRNILLLYNLFGTVIIGLSFYNLRIKNLVFPMALHLFIAGTVCISFAFYFGFWDVRLVSGRASFINHNENMLGQLLNVGLAFSLYSYFTTTVKWKSRLFLVISILHLTPILATISRTGITTLLLTVIIFIFGSFKNTQKIGFITSVFLLLMAGSTVLFQLFKSNRFLDKFVERTSNSLNDERADLWNIALNIAKENAFTGVGFSRFNDELWRIQMGLSFETNDAFNNNYQIIGASIHNSFIDLVWIGGIYLLFAYILILLFLIINSAKILFNDIKENRITGALILSLTINAVLFSFTGQGATQKITWFTIGISFALIQFVKSRTFNNKEFK